MANDTILVTGATGKVGQRLVPRLLSWREPGDEIRVLVRTREAAERFAAAGARAVVGDLTEADMVAVNRDAAVALARESAQAGIRRLVHTSTNLVYGPSRGRPAREDDELRAAGTGRRNAYPVSKRECEEQLRALSGEVGLDIVTLRLAFVYGDGDPHIRDILPYYADAAAHTPMAMVHHADVAQGVHRAMRTLRPDEGGYRAYNICGDGVSTLYELHELAGQTMDITAAESRSVEDPWFGVPDTTRAYHELGFRPIYPSAKAAWRDGML